MTKSPEQKTIEKQLKEQKKIELQAQRRDRAARIIESATYIGKFRVMDSDSETILKVAIDLYNQNPNESNRVAIPNNEVPKHLRNALMQEAENLLEYGMLTDYMSYANNVIMTLSTQGIHYFEDKIIAEESEKQDQMQDTERSIIFISHRTIDAKVADMLKNFLVGSGIPNDKIFCSSLPGNDVGERIPVEVKKKLQESTINVLILSKNYYESAYCLNEAGIAWYLNEEDKSLVIPIGLPEIDHTNMIGFINSDYKLRRLDNNNDIAYIYDESRKRLNCADVTYSVVTRETEKLKEKYSRFLEKARNKGTVPKNAADISKPIPKEAEILLLYADANDGAIRYIQIDNGEIISVGKFNLTKDQSSRNIAFWKAAIDYLCSNKFAIRDGESIKITSAGYKTIDAIKKSAHIDPEKDPLEEMKEYVK